MVETLRPDVAVIGASPAGLGAARTAAEAGAETVLLEAREEIGLPEPPAKVAFDHLWAAERPPPDHAVEQRTTEVVVHSPSGHRLTVDAPAWVLDRTAFDRGLADRLEDAGGDIRTGLGELEAPGPTHLEAPQAGLVVEPRVTVFADGAGSLAEAFLDLTQHPGALAWGAWDALPADPRLPAHRIHIAIGGHAPGGRTQLTPVGDGAWAHWTFVQGPRQEVIDRAPQALSHTLQRVGWTDGPQASARRVAVGPDPVFLVPRRLVGDRLVVAGGAAGQGGLEVGLASGEMAGRHAARAVAGRGVDPEALEAYAETWRDRYQAGYAGLSRWNRWLARLEDRQVDRLLAPWDGQRIGIEALHGLGRQGVKGPLAGLAALARERPGPMLSTIAAAVPIFSRALLHGTLTSAPQGRRPAPR